MPSPAGCTCTGGTNVPTDREGIAPDFCDWVWTLWHIDHAPAGECMWVLGWVVGGWVRTIMGTDRIMPIFTCG